MRILAAFLFIFSFITPAITSAKGDETFKNGVIVSAHPEASKVGLEILQKGGNAADAAIAVEFALAVVYPNAGNIGGGGFLIYRGKDGEVNALDYREKAPEKARENMYLSGDGEVIKNLSLLGGLASGVPGTVAGMVELHNRYGSLPWKDLVQPAITLAKQGFRLTAQQAEELTKLHHEFIQYNTLPNNFTSRTEWKVDDLFVQTDLAHTFERIQNLGFKGFYEGETANLIVAEMNRGNGMMTLEDLKNYKAIWRTPITGHYKSYKIISMPPPSSGGIALVTLFQLTENYPLQQWGFQALKTVQVMVEAERRVYADRAEHLGDPDFFQVPVDNLLNKEYINTRMNNFSFHRATPSTEVKAGNFNNTESEETTHYSIVDRFGNAVSATTTLNDSYGSRVVVGGAGFLLNNEMDDFSLKPGQPNLYGLVGGQANAIAPNKRMLSSMTPTIVEKDNKLFMVVGTPGGSTIITSVFQTILNVIEFGMTMQEAVAAPRFHHQWLPDRIDVEAKAIPSATRAALEIKGYNFHSRNNYGRVDAILVNKNGTYQAGADPRGDDKAVGY